MEALNKILDKVVDFFSIFDISFLISGIATFTMLCYAAWQYDLFVWLGNGIDCIVYYIILAYICGLVSFAFGKSFRTYGLRIKRDKQGQTQFIICFNNVIKYVNKREPNEDKLLTLFKDPEDAELYYSEMWSYIREKSASGATYNLLNRYWVSQAIYEGLLFPALLAFILGICLVLEAFIPFLKNDAHPAWVPVVGALMSLFALGCIYLFCREGKRYAETQIKEVVIIYKNLKSEP